MLAKPRRRRRRNQTSSVENCLKDEITSNEISRDVTEVTSEDPLRKRRIVECAEDEDDKPATL